ncbi:MAG: ASCH domain-containing protein [Proteobacteria bacterium]|nr:ASCH domain-containing protein [Pseudomonadota bacterium]
MHPSILQIWNVYRAANPAAPVDVPISFHFCDNRSDADLCAELVATERKRATATSIAELRLAGDPIPRPGDYAIVTNWAGEAKAVIRTASVEIRRLCEVDAAFARDEGEGDLTLEWWRTAHEAYYRRVLAGSSYIVNDDLEIACERFELVMAV